MKKWYSIVIVILTIIILVQYCSRPEKGSNDNGGNPPKEIVIKKEYIPIIDTVIQDGKTIYIPGKTIYDTNRVYDTTFLLQDIDTMAILFLYFERAIYKDTLQNDSIAFIFIEDTITENRILSRQKVIRIKPLFYPEIPRRKLYAGIGLGGNINQFMFAGKVTYIDRRERMFAFSYYPIGGFYEFSILWKIRIGKKKIANY